MLPTSNNNVKQSHDRRSNICLSSAAEIREINPFSQAKYRNPPS